MKVGLLHAIVSGRVQGVYYRASLRQEAIRLGLNGFVRNLADGRVEYLATGPEADLADLLEWSRKGPMMARVSGVETLDDEPTQDFDGFTIR